MTTSAAGLEPDFTEIPSAGGPRASWRFDSDRECDAIVIYVLDQRPSVFRWPLAVTLVVVAVLGVIVALSAFGENRDGAVEFVAARVGSA